MQEASHSYPKNLVKIEDSTLDYTEEPLDIKVDLEIGETALLDVKTFVQTGNSLGMIENNSEDDIHLQEISGFKNLEGELKEDSDSIDEDDVVFIPMKPDDNANQTECLHETIKAEYGNNINTSECNELTLMQCPLCDHTASNIFNIRSHIDTIHHNFKVVETHTKSIESCTHHKQKIINCQYCDFTAPYPYHMRRHINAVHYQLKNHKCDYCGFASSHSTHLKRHVDAVHNKIRNHKCKYCDYKASNSSHLKRHITAGHHKSCRYCDYRATNNTNLKQHVSTFHMRSRMESQM